MPALSDTLGVDLSGYTPVDKSTQDKPGVAGTSNLAPGYNVYLRCPLPQVWTSSTDTLRQYYQGNVVPQIRVMTPTPVTSGSSGSSTYNVTSVVTGGSTGGGTTTTSPIQITSASLKTPSILPGNRYTGSFTLSKAFQLLSLSATSACRVQIYGTAAAQSADAYRGLDVPLPAGTQQNMICDVVLDTVPLQWTFQDRVGANGDNPVNSNVYITVTNIDAVTDVVTLTIGFVPLVS